MRKLRARVRAWREAIATTRYRELDQLQGPPFANLSHGGAGTAYALWRLGETRRARAWLAAARADRRILATTDKPPRNPASSLLFGRAGLDWMGALLDGETAPFAARVRAGAPLIEFAKGSAGLALGALALVRRGHGSRSLVRAATAVVDHLARATRARSEKPWTGFDAVGFAHHWSGVIYAQLAWCEHAGTSPDGWLVDAIRALAVVPPDVSHSPRTLAASWCNGHAGIALLWCKAHELIGGDDLLAAARSSVQHAIEMGGIQPGLCCGDIGVAYACLALDRIDPGAGWRARAIELGTASLQFLLPHPAGLFQGHPGIVAFTLDCTDPTGSFPTLG